MEKVHVDDNNQATVICPKCKHEKIIDVTEFKDTHKRVKAKCRCGEVFRITLEFRKHKRKKVWLSGEYFVQVKDEKGEIKIEDIASVPISSLLCSGSRVDRFLSLLTWVIKREVCCSGRTIILRMSPIVRTNPANEITAIMPIAVMV